MINPQSPLLSLLSGAWLGPGWRWRKQTSWYLSALHLTSLYVEQGERMEPSDQTRDRLCRFSQLGLSFHFYQTLNKYNKNIIFPTKVLFFVIKLNSTSCLSLKSESAGFLLQLKIAGSFILLFHILLGEQRKPNRSISLSRKTRQSQIGNIVTDRKLNCPSPYLLCQASKVTAQS